MYCILYLFSPSHFLYLLKQFLYLHFYSLYRLTFHFCSLDIVAATELNMKAKKNKKVLNVLELKPTCIA